MSEEKGYSEDTLREKSHFPRLEMDVFGLVLAIFRAGNSNQDQLFCNGAHLQKFSRVSQQSALAYQGFLAQNSEFLLEKMKIISGAHLQTLLEKLKQVIFQRLSMERTCIPGLFSSKFRIFCGKTKNYQCSALAQAAQKIQKTTIIQ